MRVCCFPYCLKQACLHSILVTDRRIAMRIRYSFLVVSSRELMRSSKLPFKEKQTKSTPPDAVSKFMVYFIPLLMLSVFCFFFKEKFLFSSFSLKGRTPQGHWLIFSRDYRIGAATSRRQHTLARVSCHLQMQI